MIEESYKKILIVQVNWLGDVLFSTPFIKALRKKFKNAHISCMLVPRCKEILEFNPNIDEIIIYDEKRIHKSLAGKIRFILELRKKHFDLAILLHRSFTRTLITYLAGIKKRTGFITQKRRMLLTDPIDTPDTALHKVEYFLKIASYLGCDVSDKDYEFFITDRERDYIARELYKSGIEKKDFLVAINPGANWLPKRWPAENFAKLGDSIIAKCNAKIVITGAKKDAGLAEIIKRNMEKEALSLAGRTNLKELAGLMEKAKLVISGDTGPMHIACAVKANVIALFGPTSPDITGPYGSGNYKVIQKSVGCDVPCYDLTCNDHRCMNAITVEDVLRVFDEMYSKRSPGHNVTKSPD